MIHECPLCNLEFAGEECHSQCPFAKGCNMIRCPRCAFEFVESGILVSLARRLMRPFQQQLPVRNEP